MQPESDQDQEVAAPEIEQTSADVGGEMEAAAGTALEGISDMSEGAITSMSDGFESLLGGTPSPSVQEPAAAAAPEASFEEFQAAEQAEAQQRTSELQSLEEGQAEMAEGIEEQRGRGGGRSI